MNDNKLQSRRDILSALIFLLLVLGLFLANFIYKTPEISQTERRPLAEFPSIFVEKAGKSSLNSDFSDEFETWSADSFLARDSFRSLKGIAVFHVFSQMDNNGIFLVDGSVGKMETLNEASFQKSTEKIAALADRLPASANVWYSIIPDKGYYLSQARKGIIPTIDYTAGAEILKSTLGEAGYIDLLPALSADSYYRTDLHWRQEALGGVLSALSKAMGLENRLDQDFGNIPMDTPFYGAYYGQAAVPMQSDTLYFLISPSTDSALVKAINTETLQMEPMEMYQIEKYTGIDPYDIYLGGAQPLITIENPNAATSRQLFLFRDSFGSSLAPLLAGAYAKITLIDLRYISATLLPQLVEFPEDCDVLFLYSAQVLNNSDILLVNF